MTYRGVAENTSLVRPYIDGGTQPIHVPPLPVDVRPDREDAWREGFLIREQHYHSTDLGHCVACGSTDLPHCGWHYAGYNLMRSALWNPSSLANVGP